MFMYKTLFQVQREGFFYIQSSSTEVLTLMSSGLHKVLVLDYFRLCYLVKRDRFHRHAISFLFLFPSSLDYKGF